MADWTPVLLVIVLFSLAILLWPGNRDEDSAPDDEDDPMAAFLGRPGAGQPRLKLKNWNRQINKYMLATVEVTLGRREARLARRELEELYRNQEREEVEKARKQVKAKRLLEKEAKERELQAPSTTPTAGSEAKTEEPGAEPPAEGSSKPESDPAVIQPVLPPVDEKLALRRRVWVLGFQTGRNDVGASGVKQLREEITAVVMNADPQRDQVILKLDSPGGTVTGYGLAGAQLLRLRDAGLHLTVAIDQVAASGGYLMACTADRIVCSPFAVIGSIGVVQELPIVFERLKREGIQFETTTAGKFKRTLTPFKEPTEEDRQKNKADIEDVLSVFKDFVKTSRPTVDIDAVATGETWIGPKAKERGLVDDLLTSDALLLGLAKEGKLVIQVGFSQGRANPLSQFAQAATNMFRSVLPFRGMESFSLPMARSTFTPPSAWSGITMDE